MPRPERSGGGAAVAERTEPALELIDVHAGYGRIEVLHGVSFAVPRGSVFALLGPNGAGKSTTLKVIGGAIKPTAGCVHIEGAHVSGAAPERLAQAGVCRLPEGRGIFPNLTVAEHMQIWSYATPRSAKEVAERGYARFPRLAERRNQLAGTLSGGEQQMLAMSRALAVDPGLLLLDEISMGLAPLIVAELYEVVVGVAGEGITVVVVEQFAKTALAVADTVGVMVHGRVAMTGTPAEIEEHLHLAYLGGGAE